MNLYDLLTPSSEIKPEETDALLSVVAQSTLEKTVSSLNNLKIRMKDSSTAELSLELLLNLPKQVQNAISLHPTFCFWLQAVRRMSRVEKFDENQCHLIDQLSTLIFAPTAVTGIASGVELPITTDSHGGLRCPMYARYLEFGPNYSEKKAFAKFCTEEATLRFEDGWTMHVPVQDISAPMILEPTPTLEEHGYTVTKFAQVADGNIEVYNRDPWLRVKLSGTNQRDTGTIFDTEDLENYPDDFDLPILELALGEIKAVWPEQYEDLKKIAQVIVPIQPGRDSGHAFTVSSRQGAIFVGIRGVSAVIEMLLHENAHVKLRRIQVIEPILRDPHDESKTFFVPWRKDKRPLPGILEGTYVFTHVCEFLVRQLKFKRGPTDQIKDRLNKMLRDVAYAVDLIDKHADLTSMGKPFVQAVGDWISSIVIHSKQGD